MNFEELKPILERFTNAEEFYDCINNDYPELKNSFDTKLINDYYDTLLLDKFRMISTAVGSRKKPISITEIDKESRTFSYYQLNLVAFAVQYRRDIGYSIACRVGKSKGVIYLKLEEVPNTVKFNIDKFLAEPDIEL